MSNLYTDLTPRQAAHYVVKTLKRLRPNIVLGRFAQMKQLPKNKTNVVKWIRYRAVANAGVLNEGVAPKGKKLIGDPITAKLEQIGDVIKFTDDAIDLHPDDVMKEAEMVLDEQILDTTESMYVANIQGGSQVVYANNVAGRANVVDVVSGTDIRKALQLLKSNNAKVITRMLTGDVEYNTTPVEPAYVGYCPTEFESVLRDINGFETAEKYAGQTTLYPGEFGKYENCRFITSTLASVPLLGAGGASGAVQNTAGNADVHRIVIFGMNAYGGIPFAGPNSLNLYARVPRSTVGDELAQQAYVGWKSRFNAAILQQKALIRIESALPL